MSLYSKQTWFCNNCGCKMFSVPHKAIGNKYRTCTMECHDEISWKDTLSIMGMEYYPRPESK